MTPNLLDRAIGYVAPHLAVKRHNARVSLDAARAYTGAALGRHTDGWRAGATSADQEIASGGSRLRDRHRDLVRNNPHAAKAVASWVASIVGEGITPRCKDKRVQGLFEAWAKRCDADGMMDFYGLQTLAVREMVEAGEVIVRRRARRREDGLAVPLQVQVMEADHIDSAQTGVTASGNATVLGIEMDAIGRRVAYWLYPEHPGAMATSLATRRLSSVAVPADGVIHLYERQRTQTRGVPWGAPVIRKLRDLDDYEFAEGIRKKTEAAYVGVLLTDEDVDATVGGKKLGHLTDAQGNTVEQLTPGLMLVGRGKDIKFNAPAAVAGYADYQRVALRTIAAGYRLPYELVSGDLTSVNYSSIRAGLIEFRRLVRTIQWQLVVPNFCQPMWDWFCQAAYMAGLIESPDVPVEWDTPRFEWVDPLKDVQGDIAAMRAGVKTWEECVAERGRNPEDVKAEIIRTNDWMDKAGVVLDIDPRRVASSGALQASSPAEDDDDDKPAPPARGLQVVR